jgi:hypothetical protein
MKKLAYHDIELDFDCSGVSIWRGGSRQSSAPPYEDHVITPEEMRPEMKVNIQEKTCTARA